MKSQSIKHATSQPHLTEDRAQLRCDWSAWQQEWRKPICNTDFFILHELNGCPPFTFLQSNIILIISSIYPSHWHCPRHVRHRHLWFIRTVNC